MTRYIDTHKDRFGIEPISRTLQIAPSTYYAARSRPPSARQQRDQELKPEIGRVHGEHYGVYGAEKVWRQLRRESVEVGRDRTARLMLELGLAGITRGARKIDIWGLYRLLCCGGALVPRKQHHQALPAQRMKRMGDHQ